MRFGFVLPSGDARAAADLAHEAEGAGWDGFFVWDSVWGIDPWVMLAAAAMRTDRIRLGTMITPVSRRRPWKLAGETAALDNLSGGRVILSVGLGAIDTGFGSFGEETDRKRRAELLDEGLDIVTGLWKGQPFNYDGKHYKVRETTFFSPPPPVQQPRIPIWVVGAWPRLKSMERALRWDGLIPSALNEDGTARQANPEELSAMKAYIDEHRRASTPFDIVVEGETPGDDAAAAAEVVGPWVDAGATWWLEARWSAPDLDAVAARIKEGPAGVRS
ncbi:MAG TPA: LLM class flavin-dependent oxidoreductase [Acidimicrobiales bacterium]|jgi:alkanesulfonate monooxygenase SsuD/methylene tetrahydromethanopterin reductase-like flavin-dependent oxidoreductase (luciferase family)